MHNCNRPLISIIVPVYNMEKYIGQCLESICAQTYKNIEVIIVNDGSTDASERIIRVWQEKDERIVLFEQENQGLAAARNVGIANAKGEYIGFVDADDYIENQMYEALYHTIWQNNCMISMCAFRIVDEKGSPIPKNIGNPKSQIYDPESFFHTAVENRTYYGMCACAWNKLYKKSLFDNLLYPAGKLHEDNWVIHKLVYKAKKVAFIDQELYCYRRTDNGIMHCTFSLKRFDNYFAQVDRVAFLQKNHASKLLINQWKVDCVKLGIGYWFQMKDAECATEEEEKKYYYDVRSSIKDFVEVCPFGLRVKGMLFMKTPHLLWLLHCVKQK